MADADSVLYQLNYYKPLIDRAIQLTENYVSSHKLVLTGGMAIDLALRVKGKSIYDDNTLPDFDIISDENLHHAHELARIMCEDGLPDINVINAVHITTVRVRMKNIVFLDSTYVPKSVFNKIPYLDVGHLRVVHPHYQFIDQRSSLAHLMMDTGISLNIFNRLSKDVNRNLLLREEYPIMTSDVVKLKMREVAIPLSLVNVDTTKLDFLDENAFVYTGATCISGYLAYKLIMHQHDNSFNYSISNDELIVSIPDNVNVSLLTVDIDRVRKYIKSPRIYRPLVNLKPITLESGDIDFVDTYGQRNGCFMIKLRDDLTVCVASTDYILMEFLRDRIYVDELLYSSFYETFVQEVDKMRNISDSDDIWWPSINCYGRDNLPEYKMFMLEKLMYPEKATTLKPRNSYPKQPKCKNRTGFDHDGSHYFQIDGHEDNTIKFTNYKFIIDEFNNYINKKKN